MLLEDRGPPDTSANQPRDDSVQMRGKRGLPSCRRRLGSSSALHDTDRAAPILEEIEDVALAELDADWTPFGWTCLHTLTVSIDAATRDRQRDAALSPAAHLFERRPDDPHEVSAVLPTEVGLELAAVFREVGHPLETIANCRCHKALHRGER